MLERVDHERKIVMGNSILIDCRDCGESKDWALGFGLLYQPYFDNLLKNFLNKRQTARLLTKIGVSTVIDCAFSHKLFQCPRCNFYSSRFSYSVILEDNRAIHSNHRCSVCRARLQETESQCFDDIGWSCDSCGSTNLVFAEYCWD
jgi:hypothetical protein